jgi:hypothetical protein
MLERASGEVLAIAVAVGPGMWRRAGSGGLIGAKLRHGAQNGAPLVTDGA